MSRATVLRSLRLPVLVLAVIIALWITMLSLERTAPATQSLKSHTVAAQSTAKSNAAPAASNNNPNANTAHCTDGHGQDGNKNPHCRAGSQG